MLKRFILATVGFLLAANANAADGAYSWQGAYVGGQIGASWGKGEYDHNRVSKVTYNAGWLGDLDYISWGQGSDKISGSNFIGGVYLGYNFEVTQKFIFGIEGDVAWGKNKNNSYSDAYRYTGDSAEWSSAFSSVKSSVKSKYNGAFRARLGYAADRFMPYIAGGIAVTKIQYSEAIHGEIRSESSYSPGAQYYYNPYDESGSNSKTATGYTVGLGTDYALTDNILLRTEYRYTDFGSVDISPYSDEGSNSYKVKYKSHDIRFGIAYKF